MVKNDHLCECGCGQITTLNKYKGYSRYVIGHNRRGKKSSEATKILLRTVLKGRIHTSEQNNKRSRSLTGRAPVYSPFLPDRLVNFGRKAQRWRCSNPRTGKSMLHSAAVYEYFFGSVPDGFHVHHKDGNGGASLDADRPDNLIAVPAKWNLTYLPTLASGFGVPESEVTAIYLQLIDTIDEAQLFAEVCRRLCNEQTAALPPRVCEAHQSSLTC